MFIILCLIVSRFLILFIYIVNIGYWQVLFITKKQLEQSYSATFNVKCRGFTAAVLAMFGMKLLNIFQSFEKPKKLQNNSHHIFPCPIYGK